MEKGFTFIILTNYVANTDDMTSFCINFMVFQAKLPISTVNVLIEEPLKV